MNNKDYLLLNIPNDKKESKLNVSSCGNLISLACNENNLIDINLNNCNNLKSLDVRQNKLEEINIEDIRSLLYIQLNGNNKLEQINIKNNDDLLPFSVEGTNINCIDVTKQQKYSFNYIAKNPDLLLQILSGLQLKDLDDQVNLYFNGGSPELYSLTEYIEIFNKLLCSLGCKDGLCGKNDNVKEVLEISQSNYNNPKRYSNLLLVLIGLVVALISIRTRRVNIDSIKSNLLKKTNNLSNIYKKIKSIIKK